MLPAHAALKWSYPWNRSCPSAQPLARTEVTMVHIDPYLVFCYTISGRFDAPAMIT